MYPEIYPVGDFNGDGFDDFVSLRASHVYVIYGSADGLPESINDSARDGSRGFTLLAGNENLEGQVEITGDVNGDGYDDVFVGTGVRYGLDGVYILYGQAVRPDPLITLDEIEDATGFRFGLSIEGADFVIDGIGDFNGDGLDDWKAGNAVVYGRDDQHADFALTALNGINGFQMVGGTDTAISPVGDTNGDGVTDIFVNTPYTDVSYVVFGRQAVDRPASAQQLRWGRAGRDHRREFS